LVLPLVQALALIQTDIMVKIKGATAGPGVAPLIKRIVIGVSAVALTVLWGHYLLLAFNATRGDVPEAADMRFPAGAVVISTEEHCRAELCWSTFYVAPPPGMTATKLTTEIASASVGGILGSFSDPRLVNARATLNGRSRRRQLLVNVCQRP
jgi:hypothetical protein